MLQALRNNNEKGFTLIELMIVIAIIGILAAIAVPQFMTYRLRSYNTTAKSTVHNMKVDESNLNSELGVYGHTEAAAADLTAADAGVDVADSSADAALALPATATVAGARLAGTTNDGLRSLAIGISIGANMIADVQDFNTANDDSTFHAHARAFKGDTAYAIDGDVDNVLYSVSNPNWPNLAGIQATAVPPAGVSVDDFGSAGPKAGGGLPTANWTLVR